MTSVKIARAGTACRKLLNGALQLVFPNDCALCGSAYASGSLCARCRAELCQTARLSVCPRCAGTVGPFAGTAQGCSLCRRDRFAFDRVIRLGAYAGPLAKACRQIKHLAGYRLTFALADLLCENRQTELGTLGIDLVAPVPLHWWRRFRRRYDQAAALAERIARRLDRPMAPALLRRRRSTPPQARLAPTQRRANLRNAFVAQNPHAARGRSVLLVDDILTTGATCHEAARALRAAGATRVFVAVIARGEGTN